MGKLQPRVWVLDVDTIPTVAFEALNNVEAKELAREEWLRSDLARLTSAGAPLWKPGQRISARAGTDDETTVYRQGALEAEPVDEMTLVFLRPLGA